MQPVAVDRAALDSSALLGSRYFEVFAAARLKYYQAFWSPWIVAEYARKRTEWVADRAAREGADRVELRRRLRQARERTNRDMRDLSGALVSVDYESARNADLGWLRDRDDWPVMQTAIAAAADVLVTDNTRDFPPGEIRNGILILTSSEFLSRLYQRLPEAEAAVRAHARGARSSQR